MGYFQCPVMIHLFVDGLVCQVVEAFFNIFAGVHHHNAAPLISLSDCESSVVLELMDALSDANGDVAGDIRFLLLEGRELFLHHFHSFLDLYWELLAG